MDKRVAEMLQELIGQNVLVGYYEPTGSSGIHYGADKLAEVTEDGVKQKGYHLIRWEDIESIYDPRGRQMVYERKVRE